jgi:PadR family transcriptional regulator PadR
MRSEALKGHLGALILAALEGGSLHGYAIMDALRTASGGRVDLPTGTLYPALHRLEERGLIAGSWSTVGGRRRRSYRLTEAGGRALAGERADWREFTSVIGAVLEARPWPNPA